MTISRMEKFKNPRLLAPGPVPLSDEILSCLAQPMIHHRTPEFTAQLSAAHEKLKSAFQTTQPVFILPSTGSGAMEAALVNTLSPGDEILVVVGGKFGERWAKMGEAFGLKVHTLNVEWGTAVSPQQVQDQIDKLPNLKAVLCQASETSTATWHPVEELAPLFKNTPILFMVDAISGVGVKDLAFDELGIDVMVSGAQKAFMIPTGLSFIALSKKAWKATESSQLPKFYFDLKLELKSYNNQQTLFSSPVSLVRALNLSLDRLTGKELKDTILKTQKMSRATQKAVTSLGLRVFSQNPSPAVTAISVPEGIDGAKLRVHIEKEYKVTLMGGQDHLKGKILRIGHIGFITPDDLDAGIHALVLGLKDFGWKGFSQEQLDQTLSQLKADLQ